MSGATTGQGHKRRVRPVCRQCGRKIGNAWSVRPSESYKSYDPETNTYVCSPCRYEQAWATVICPRCSGQRRRRVSQLKRTSQWQRGVVERAEDGSYLLLCVSCANKELSPTQEKARSSNAQRLAHSLPDRVRHWSRSTLERKLSGLFDGSIPLDLRQRVDCLLPQGQVGRGGYRIYREALSRRAVDSRPARPTTLQAKAARSARPRQSLGMFLRYLTEGRGLVYQCRICGELAHLRSGHVARGGFNSGFLCAPCWRKHPERPLKVRVRPGRAIESQHAQAALILSIHRRLGDLNRPLTHTEAIATARIEGLLRRSRHPWCQKLVAALDRLAPL